MRAAAFIVVMAAGLLAAGYAAGQPYDPRMMQDAALCNGSGPPPAEIIAACTRVIQSPRANADIRSTAYNNRAYESLMLGRHNQAIEDFDAAIELAPHYWSALISRSTAYLEKRELDLAMIDIESAIAIDRRDTAPLAVRARILAAMGLHKEAMNDVNRRGGARDADYFLARGTVHSAIGKPEQALEDFRTGLKLKPAPYVRLSIQRAIGEVETRQRAASEQEEVRKRAEAKKQAGGDDPPAVVRPKNPFE